MTAVYQCSALTGLTGNADFFTTVSVTVGPGCSNTLSVSVSLEANGLFTSKQITVQVGEQGSPNFISLHTVAGLNPHKAHDIFMTRISKLPIV